MVVGVWTLAGEGTAWVWDNGVELLRIGFGLVDVGLGAAAIYFTGGVGGVLGGAGLIGVGVDQIVAGVWNIRNGKTGHGFSKLEQAVYDLTGSETAAFLAPAVASIGAAGLAHLAAIRPLGAGLQPGELAIIGKPGVRGTRTNDHEVRATLEILGRVFGLRVFQNFGALGQSAGDTLLIVVGHGGLAANSVKVGAIKYSAAELAELLLRTAPASTTHVKILSCFAGNRRLYGLQSSLAQEVANRTGWIVTAPRGIVRVFEDGSALVRPWIDTPYGARGVGWSVFQPGRWWVW